MKYILPARTHGSIFEIGGRSTCVVPGSAEPFIRKGDIIGCALDLTVPIINFYFNGVKIRGAFKNFNLDGMFFPVISVSAKVRYEIVILPHHALLKIHGKMYFALSIDLSSISCNALKNFTYSSCRFLFGGDQGRLRFPSPEGHSPLVECLQPTQILSIDPCFYFGDLVKGVLAGPLFVEDDVAFVPQPVDTKNVNKWVS